MKDSNSATSNHQDSAINQQINSSKKRGIPPFKMEYEVLGADGETVLHTIIPTLANYKGLVFKQEPAQHIHRHGGTAYYENKRGAANDDISGVTS